MGAHSILLSILNLYSLLRDVQPSASLATKVNGVKGFKTIVLELSMFRR